MQNCQEFAPAAIGNALLYEGGEPVFIDITQSDWGMDPAVLELAFARYPDTKLVVLYHACGFPGQINAIRQICDTHGAILIEDASEALGAAAEGKKAASIGDYSIISFNREGVIPVGVGSVLLTDDEYSARKARYWSSGAYADAKWNQHEELGYQYGLDNVTAGIIRGQLLHLQEHLNRKKEIYEHYRDRLDEETVRMNPVGDTVFPNYAVSCILPEDSIPFQEISYIICICIFVLICSTISCKCVHGSFIAIDMGWIFYYGCSHWLKLCR